MEGNLDFCFDPVKFGIPVGHMEETSGMKLDVWLAVIRYFELEIQLENLSTGLDVSTVGNGLDRAEGLGLCPEKLWYVSGNDQWRAGKPRGMVPQEPTVTS